MRGQRILVTGASGYLGRQVDARVQEALATRRLLLGRGWTLARLAAATGMLSA